MRTALKVPPSQTNCAPETIGWSKSIRYHAASVNLDAKALHLLKEPLLSLCNSLLKLRRLGTGSLSAGLLAAGLAANDLAYGRSPLLGGNALGREMLQE